MSIEKWQSWTPKANPHEPAEWDEDVVFAMRALNDGVANEGQQRLVMQWIKYVAAVGEFSDLSFRPGEDGERKTTFAEGKRFVGLQILKMLHPATFEAVEREREKRERGSARG